MIKVKLKGLSRKWKNKIKEYGDWWVMDRCDELDGTTLLSTTYRVHCGGQYPYSCWGRNMYDFIIEESKNE